MSIVRACALQEVIEADTLRVLWEGQPHMVRLLDVSAETARPRGASPATSLGRKALAWARTHLDGAGQLELEQPDADFPASNGGRILAVAHARGENYNVRLVREGWSPVFEKYGHPQLYRRDMERAEYWARLEGRGIWGGAGQRGDYRTLKWHWLLRAGQVKGFRHARAMGEDVLSCRLHYADVVSRARAGIEACVFGDLVRLFELADGSILIRMGSPQQSFTAFFHPPRRELAYFIEREFIGPGKPNYVYLSGPLSMAGEHPQIVLERLEQLSIHPPKTHD